MFLRTMIEFVMAWLMLNCAFWVFGKRVSSTDVFAVIFYLKCFQLCLFIVLILETG